MSTLSEKGKSMPHIRDLEELRNLIEEQKSIATPMDVRVVGTSFGNELQSKINGRLFISNLLLFYICTFLTFRYVIAGN